MRVQMVMIRKKLQIFYHQRTFSTIIIKLETHTFKIFHTKIYWQVSGKKMVKGINIFVKYLSDA